jgi:hypothetical protein
MMAKTSGDSSRGVSTNIFAGIQDSFTTQGLPTPGFDRNEPNPASGSSRPREPPTSERRNPYSGPGVRVVWRSDPMPYALFCNEAKLSKAYPTEADVWKLARLSGLVVDAVTEEEKPAPRPVLDNDYEIKPCRPDLLEDPAQNRAEAERDAQLEFSLRS